MQEVHGFEVRSDYVVRLFQERRVEKEEGVCLGKDGKENLQRLNGLRPRLPDTQCC